MGPERDPDLSSHHSEHLGPWHGLGCSQWILRVKLTKKIRPRRSRVRHDEEDGGNINIWVIAI